MRTVLAALVLAAGVHSAAAPSRPQTLYLSPPHQQIAAFAQDGSYVAWLAPSRTGCNVVHVLALANGGQIRLPDESATARNVTCRWEVVQPVGLALASEADDVLWTLREPAPLPFDYVLGAGFTDPQERRFGEIAHGNNGTGLWLGGIAGDGKTLVYAVSSVAYVDQVACLAGGSCRRKLIGGGIHKIVGRDDRLVPGTSATLAIAVSGDRIADVQAAGVGKDGDPIASARLPIEIRDAGTGKVLTRVVPRGVPDAVALSPAVLATLERSALGPAHRLVQRARRQHARLRSRAEEHEPGAVGRRTADRLPGGQLDPGRRHRLAHCAHADEGGGDADRAVRAGQPRRLGGERQRARENPRAVRGRERLGRHLLELFELDVR